MLASTSRLRANCLNLWEVLAQAIALISPTMTAALIVPLMYGTTGNVSWLAYAFGTVMLLFVAFNLNQFARRSSHTGSMFLYSVAGLGPTAGALSGWCLIWAYLFIGTAGVTGFTIFAQTLLAMAGLHVPAIPLFALCAFAAWFLAYRDIQLSTIMMLVIEAASVAIITALALIALAAHGFAIDTAQVTMQGGSLSTLGLGVVIAIFSLVGFECATAFGDEARSPLTTIPRAVIASLLITGVFFVFISYVEIAALRGANPPLDKLTTPLSTLATLLHLDVLQVPIDVFAMTSFFSLALSCMNAGARVVYQMGKQGFFHASTGAAHETNATPHVAVTIYAVLEVVVASAMTFAGLGVSDAFNDAGTFGAFGFLGAYVFVCVAAPLYLRKIGQLKPLDVTWSVVALAFLLVPAIGSVYPVPAPPVNLFPYIFAAYFLVGLAFFVTRRGATKLASAPLDLDEAVPAA